MRPTLVSHQRRAYRVSLLGCYIQPERGVTNCYDRRRSDHDLIMIWDTHAALELHSVSVVGGQVTGVGLAGFILGGGECDQSLDSTRTVTQDNLGYLWLTNQHGLAIDSLQPESCSLRRRSIHWFAGHLN